MPIPSTQFSRIAALHASEEEDGKEDQGFVAASFKGAGIAPEHFQCPLAKHTRVISSLLCSRMGKSNKSRGLRPKFAKKRPKLDAGKERAARRSTVASALKSQDLEDICNISHASARKTRRAPDPPGGRDKSSKITLYAQMSSGKVH